LSLAIPVFLGTVPRLGGGDLGHSSGTLRLFSLRLFSLRLFSLRLFSLRLFSLRLFSFSLISSRLISFRLFSLYNFLSGAFSSVSFVVSSLGGWSFRTTDRLRRAKLQR